MAFWKSERTAVHLSPRGTVQPGLDRMVLISADPDSVGGEVLVRLDLAL